MAAPKDLNSAQHFARYILMQHQYGVSVTLNIFPGETPEVFIEEYNHIVNEVAKIHGYAEVPDDGAYERGRRRGAASRGRRR